MVPQRVHTVVISCQHDDDVSNEKIRADLQEHVIKHVVPAKYLDDETIYHLNPSGRFVIGGPHGDAGLTGRKIIIDTYGGWGAHGGGAFSGKDPTKVSPLLLSLVLEAGGGFECGDVSGFLRRHFRSSIVGRAEWKFKFSVVSPDHLLSRDQKTVVLAGGFAT